MSMNNETVSCNGTIPQEIRISLIFIYSAVFLGGMVSTAFMINSLKSNMRSVTTMATTNITIMHSAFLLTVPFRIHYYLSDCWVFGTIFCKMTSGIIHLNMYISFIFYVIILVIRYVAHLRNRERMEFYRKIHALAISLGVWAVVFLIVIPLFFVNYGFSGVGDNTCFNFGGEVKNTAVAVMNYTISTIFILAAAALTGCQAYLMAKVVRKVKKYKMAMCSHQEFWAQLKSLLFLLVLVICFIPYNMFRVFYISHYKPDLQLTNEVFLAFTTLSCFDMLIFTARNIWETCKRRCC